MVTKTKQEEPKTAIVQWKGVPLTISFKDVKSLICPLATDQETAVFLRTCQSLQLNPFAGEIFLIKYGEEDKAAVVISINSYLKAAEANEKYNGCEAGIILRDSSGKLEFREGSFLLSGEEDKLVGGWARVHRKDRSRPSYMAVNKTECIRYTKSGKPTRFWTKEKQPSMLRKVALKRALVEAFPSLFAGTLASAETGDDDSEMIEGEMPPALEKSGQPNWKKFHARVKSELGLTVSQAHELLEVESFKDLLSDGWTMEDIWNGLVSAVQGRKETVDAETGEIIDSTAVDEPLFEDGETAEAEASAEEEKRLKRDPESVTTLTELMKACFADFKMQPMDVYAELNVKSASEITEKPSDCYRRIAVVRE